MAFFVRLTGVDGAETLVNIDQVTSIRAFPSHTAIFFDKDNALSVKESPYHIIGGLPDGQSTSAKR